MKNAITLIIGTRPEAIKLAPVFFALRERGATVQIVSTGQHAQLLDDAFDAFGLSPDIGWQMMEADQTPDRLHEKLSVALDDYFETASPAYVVVQGDTTTAMSAAVAARKKNIPVGHVEAGVRSGNLEEPWPEEVFRREISRVATHHFAPTTIERDTLQSEGIDPDSIAVTGNTVIDAMHRFSSWRNTSVDPTRVLVTIHRRENVRDQFAQLTRVLNHVTQSFPDLQFDIVAHPNPNVLAFLERVGADNLRRIAPIAYPDMLERIARSVAVLTDSGGVQEEASEIGTPVIVLRDFPDRFPKKGSWNAGRDPERCETMLREILTLERKPTAGQYGDGAAADRIASIILESI